MSLENKDESIYKEIKIKVDRDIIEYIKKQLIKGISKDEIKNALIKVGHEHDKIEQYFSLIEGKNKKHPNFLLFLLILFVIVSVISVALNFILYKKQDLVIRYDELVYASKDLCTNGEYEKAFKKLNKAVELNEKRGFAFAMYGYCYVLQEKYEEAIITLTQATKLDAPNPLHLYWIGVAYCNLNNYNFGTANLKRSIELNPNLIESHKSISECYAKAGNQEEADKHLKIASMIASIDS